MTPSPHDSARLAQEKQQAAAAAVRWIRDGMLVGLGSGSTAAQFITLLGDAVRAGLRVRGTATSRASEALARDVGIPLVEPRRGLRFDVTVDGADELDAQLRLIKGGGGALLREKVLATASRYLLILADSSKLVPRLGAFPLPLEVVPFALPWVLDAVQVLGGRPTVRPATADAVQPAQTDQGNLLVDCDFGLLTDPEQLAGQLLAIPGVVEQGLFIGLAKAALVVQEEQVTVVRRGVATVAAADFAALPPATGGAGDGS